ncbi:MAG TPA: aldolase/citrate lyase family protein [Chloroflexota bacterium]|nr:aldolase/citrate lyase family protein [Chloroflexota bacterium]
MIENTILKKNRQGLKALTFSLTFPSSQLIELAARSGFDAINLDGEHGAFTPESVDLMCRVANGYGMSVTARVPSIEPYVINLWLDRGIQGIVGPHVETAEEAQRLADACLFPPAGKRSWGGGRGTEFNEDHHIENVHGGKPAFAKWANENMLVMAQIESKKAYDNLDEILAVPGLYAITGGPNDFAASLGFPGQPNHPERQRLTEDAEARARRAGKQVASDLTTGLAIQDLMISSGRAFVEKHANDRIGQSD